MAAALRQEAMDIVEAASRASLPDMAVVMAPINKGALRPPTVTFSGEREGVTNQIQHWLVNIAAGTSSFQARSSTKAAPHLEI